VPNVVGMPITQAEQILAQAGFVSGVREQSSTAPTGTVTEQSPAPGSQLPSGAAIALTTSTPPAHLTPKAHKSPPLGKPVPAPCVAPTAGGPVQTPSAAPTAPGLVPPSANPTQGVAAPSAVPSGKGGAAAPSVVPSGKGGAAAPSAVPSGKGGAAAAVPSVIGMTQVQAVQILQAAGFTVIVHTETPVGRSVPAGAVWSQTPPAGSEVPRGAAITLDVAP
jgi:beta-lactam-binding protein with PASTA domain